MNDHACRQVISSFCWMLAVNRTNGVKSIDVVSVYDFLVGILKCFDGVLFLFYFFYLILFTDVKNKYDHSGWWILAGVLIFFLNLSFFNFFLNIFVVFCFDLFCFVSFVCFLFVFVCFLLFVLFLLNINLIKDWSQFLFGSWRNNLNQVVHTLA